MKYFLAVLTFCFITSCGGTKETVTQTQKEVVTPVEKVTAPAAPVTPVETTVIDAKETIEAAVVTPAETAIEASVEKASETVEKIVAIAPKTTVTHTAFNTLLQKHVSTKGNVNYNGFRQDRSALKAYITYLGANMPKDSWSKNDKLAYWINAYNALTIDLILRHWPVKSIKDISKPWDQRFWKLGNKWYNLNEIEHDILRKMDDPRIHFAIVCASFSCPKLQNKTFKASSMDQQLTAATKEFLSDKSRNTITAHTLELSKIFQWFSKDFKQNGNLIDFLNIYSNVKIAANAKKRFKDYNWSLNE